MTHFAIVGAGGHAKVLFDILASRRDPGDVVTMHDRDEDVPLTGPIAIGVGNKASTSGSGLDLRGALFAKFHDRIIKIEADSAVIRCITGRGTQVLANAIINAGAQVGENCIINTAAIVEHDCIVGDHSHIAPGATLCGGVIVGPYTHIGAGALVKQGVRIGERCVIGMGARIRHDVNDGEVVW